MTTIAEVNGILLNVNANETNGPLERENTKHVYKAKGYQMYQSINCPAGQEDTEDEDVFVAAPALQVKEYIEGTKAFFSGLQRQASDVVSSALYGAYQPWEVPQVGDIFSAPYLVL